jgi:hypothetical protein
MKTKIEKILNLPNNENFKIDSNHILNIYHYGSRVYHTYNVNSDYDYIIIYDDITPSSTLIIESDGIVYNVTLITPEDFKMRLKLNCIDMLECVFLPDNLKYETIKFDVNIDLNNLRRSISAVCSNSFVKCKKKISQNDDYVGKKSLFHSLRIADLGIQLAKCRKIVDYTKPKSDTLKYESFKVLLDEVMTYNTWDELKDKYQNIANNLRTEFRIVAPLKED